MQHGGNYETQGSTNMAYQHDYPSEQPEQKQVAPVGYAGYPADRNDSAARGIFCPRSLMLPVCVIIFVFGVISIVLGFVGMNVDSGRKYYKSMDEVYKPMMEEMGRRYIRERWGFGYLGFGIWLGGALTLTGLIGVVDHIMQGSLRVFLVCLTAFSLLCSLTMLVMSSYSILEEDRLCEPLMYAESNWRTCEGPYSTTTMKAIYGGLICVALLCGVALLYFLALANFNRREKRVKKGRYSAAPKPQKQVLTTFMHSEESDS